jgi:hypothetical protein
VQHPKKKSGTAPDIVKNNQQNQIVLAINKPSSQIRVRNTNYNSANKMVSQKIVPGLEVQKLRQALSKRWLVALAASISLVAPTVAGIDAQAQAQNAPLEPIEACGSKGCSLNYGSKATIGKGTAKAYAFVEGGQAIKEIGVLLSSGVLKGLPQNCGSEKPSPGAKWMICQASKTNPKAQMNDAMVTTLDMPKNVIDLANIERLDISWLPLGHAPEKVWDKPQFDIHFPFRNPTGGLNRSLDYKAVSKAQLPAGYMVLPGSGFDWDTEALKGHSHAADPKNSPEFAGQPFLGNFLYITYDGKAIGYEVYASTRLLDSKEAYTRSLEMPEYSPGTRNIPSKLRIVYVPSIDSYRVSLYDYKELPAGYQGSGHGHGDAGK